MIGRVTFYETLGVHRNSTCDEIKQAWKVKSRTMHPDANIGKPAEVYTWAFAKLTEAYGVLKSRTTRAAYNSLLDLTGDLCATCSGNGFVSKQKSGFIRVSSPCTVCGGTGRRLRANCLPPETPRAK